MSDGIRNDEAVVSLVVDASGLRRGSDEATAFGKRVLDSLRGVTQAAQQAGANITESSNKIVKGLNDQSRFINQVARDLNPFKASIDSASAALKRLDGIMLEGGANAQKASALFADQTRKVADLQRVYSDASAHVGDWAKNQAAATNTVIDNLKRYSIEQAKAAQEQMKFAQQMAPSSNIAEHTAMFNKMIDNLKRYQAEQNRAQQDQFKFVQQIAPQMSIADHNKQQAKDAKDAADAIKNIRNSQLAEEKHQFDLETSYYEKLAATQKKNISETIANLKAYQAEQARATVEAEKFAKQFFTATAPQSSIAAHNKELKDAEDKTKKFNDAQNELTQTSRSTQYALTNLSFQVNDVVSGLAMGQSGFRIFAQQAGQFVQVFQQGGGVTAVLTNAAAAVGRWTLGIAAFVTGPIGLAVTGVVAFTAAMAAGVTRAISMSTEIRNLNLAMTALGTSSIITGKELANQIELMRQAGISNSDANKILLDISRNQAFNPAAAGQIGIAAANIGGTLGGTTAENLQKLTTAFSGGVKAAADYAISLNALSGSEASNMLRMAEHGRTGEALSIIFDKINAKFKDGLLNSMSSGQRAMQAFSEAWNNLLDTLSKSKPVEFIVEQFTALFNITDKLFKLGPPDWLTNGFKAYSDFIDKWILFRNGPQGVMQGPQLKFGDSGANVTLPEVTVTAPAPRFNATGPNTFSRNGLDFSSPDLERLATVIASAIQHLPSGTQAIATSTISDRASGTTNHPNARALDVKLILPNGQELIGKGPDTTTMFSQLAAWAFLENQRQFPGTSIASGGRFGTVSGGKIPDWMHFDTGPDRGNLGPPLPVLAQNLARAGIINLGDIEKGNFAISEQDKKYKDLLATRNLIGVQSELLAAKQNAETEAASKGWNETQTKTAVEQAELDVLNKYTAEVDNQNKLIRAGISGIDNTTAAFAKNTEEGLRSKAVVQAADEVRAKFGTTVGREAEVQEKATLILSKARSELASSSQEQVAAMTPQLAAQERLIAAYGISVRAGKEQEAANQAIAATEGLVAASKAKNGGVIDDVTARIRLETIEKTKNLEVEKARVAFQQQAAQGKNDLQVLQLQTQLVGQLPERIQAQVAVLQTIQKLETDRIKSSDIVYQNAVNTTIAIENQKIRLADAQREWARIEDMVKGLATTIDNTLTKTIEDAFNDQKVTDWGTKLKNMFASLVSQISSNLFIKPLLGTVLSGLGFSAAGSSFGNLFGSSSGGILGSGGNILTGTVGGQPATFNLGTGLQGAGLLKDIFGSSSSSSSSGGFLGNLFGGSSGSGSSSIGNFFSNPFGLFGSNVSGLSESSISSLGSLIGIEPSSLGFLGQSSTIPGSLFSSSFGSLLGGAGAGFGAGSLLNSLLGGNKTTGTIGSGIGSLLGAGLGSLFGFPMLGGLLGGPLGSLFGLFGNNKPSNASAGGNIDLSTGRAFGTFSGGNSSIDQPTLQAVQTISQFTQTLLKASGGTLSGSVLLQNGVNTGFTADSSLPGFEGRFNLGKDATNAINEVELALSRSIQGISDTMKNVIASITDPSQLEAAITFVGVYDNMKKAADSAFASISNDTDQLGPFATALNQITDLFKGINDQAALYNLPLDPVEASKKEALKRLTTDFNNSVSDAILAITDPTQQMLDVEKKAGEARVKEAEAVGGDLVEVAKLNALLISQIGAQSVEDIKNQFKSVDDFKKSLMFGDLSGKGSGARLSETLGAFQNAIGQVLGGDLTKIADVNSFGQSAIQLSIQNSGNDKQTSTLRASILDDLNTILAGRGFASGSDSTPPGWIQVHKDEWMWQQGGSIVLPKGTPPPGMNDNEALTEAIVSLGNTQASLLSGGNKLAAQIGEEIVKRFDKQIKILEQTPVYQPIRNVV